MPSDSPLALGEKVAAALARRLPINLIPMDDLATFSHLPPLSLLGRTWQGQCTGGLLNLFVRANGDVTPCSALAFPECVVGNVRRESLRAVCLEERCKKNLAWLRPEALTGASGPDPPTCQLPRPARLRARHQSVLMAPNTIANRTGHTHGPRQRPDPWSVSPS